MGSAAIAPVRLLTAREDHLNRFDAKPGMLNLSLKDINGSTNLDSATVKDITNSASPVEVSHTRTQSGLSFQVEAEKAYLITLAFAQTTSPYATIAELCEGEQRIDLIDMNNLFPGYVVYA